MKSQYYSTKDAAAYLRYSVFSIRRFVRDGKLVPINQQGHPRFSQAALDAFLCRQGKAINVSTIAPVVGSINPLLQQAMSK